MGPVQGEGGEKPLEETLAPQDNHPHTPVGFHQQTSNAAGGNKEVGKDERLRHAPDVCGQVVHVRRRGGPG
eukprot:928347-Alexandrium_andersonii.AAC.1